MEDRHVTRRREETWKCTVTSLFVIALLEIPVALRAGVERGDLAWRRHITADDADVDVVVGGLLG